MLGRNPVSRGDCLSPRAGIYSRSRRSARAEVLGRAVSGTDGWAKYESRATADVWRTAGQNGDLTSIRKPAGYAPLTTAIQEFGSGFRPATRFRPPGLCSPKPVEYSWATGIRRLPARRFPSKLCAALVLPRGLRVDGPNSSLSAALVDLPLRSAAVRPRAKFRGFVGVYQDRAITNSPRCLDRAPLRCRSGRRARRGFSF